MLERVGRTIICSVVFMDIVGYSKEADETQISMKALLNDLLSRALSGIAESERLIIDTGDGAALCFLGDPEDALFVAKGVTDALLAESGDGAHVLRTGINLGPIKVVADLNGRANAIGDGINVAQRIMSFAGDNEILVSRSYYEVVARLSEGNEKLFRYLGIRKDKHVREHQIYAFGLSAEEPSAPAAAARTETAGDGNGEPAVAFGEDELALAERRLADRIGPLARILVERAAAGARDLGALYHATAAAIPDEADRAAYLAEGPAEGESRRGAPAADAPPTVAPGERQPIGEAELAEAVSRLAESIGPLAGVLVKRTAKEAADRDDLYTRLATHIDDKAERERFLAAANPAGS